MKYTGVSSPKEEEVHFWQWLCLYLYLVASVVIYDHAHKDIGNKLQSLLLGIFWPLAIPIYWILMLVAAVASWVQDFYDRHLY